MMKTPFRATFMLLLLAEVLVAQNNDDPCTVCTDGSEVPDGANPNYCGPLTEYIAGTDADSDFCNEVQLTGYKDCMCPTFPTDVYCNMCDYDDDGYVKLSVPADFARTVVIPGTMSTTCQQAEFPPANEDALCTYVRSAAWFCGCPNAERSGNNYLCGDDGDQSPPANGERILPAENYGLTCAVLDRASGIGDYDFETVVSEIPLDVSGYCGCPNAENAEPPATCQLCDDEVVNPDFVLSQAGGMSCNEMDVMVSWVNQDDACQTFRNDFGGTCCKEIVPTAAPTKTTPSPVEAESVPGPTAQPTVPPPPPSEETRSTSSALMTMTLSSATFAVVATSAVLL